ncbi:MAG: glycosyl transferase group 1 [Paenibacillus sp.]|nr:glycosyl transferase group 1 [Paenibacillus sp.]
MGTISLLTHSFLDGYNQEYNRVFGGGLERYIADLCEVIREAGEEPEVHQLSYFKPFHSVWNGVNVYGHNYHFDQVPQAFEAMAAQARGKLIYASCMWHPLTYRPGSLGICHGINWDSPRLPHEAKSGVAAAIQNALLHLSAIVSVDSHFQTYCRSVCCYEQSDLIKVIPNAVDTAYFVPGKIHAHTGGKLRIVYPRRISAERGIVPMMRLADELITRYPFLEVEFAGEIVKDSPVGDAFEVWRQAHPHSNRIFQNVYTFDTIRKAYHAADIAVIPTIFSEGTSYACLEALSCGLPVVSTNVGGLNDLIIDGYNGLLVPPTSEALTAAVGRLVHDPSLRRRLGEAARRTALAFDKRIWKRRWQTVLESYLDSPS